MSDFSSSEDECTNFEVKILQKKFNAAADYVQKNCSVLEQNILLNLYGFYKQATCGECNIPKPGLFNFQAKSKWEAWNKLGKMSKEESMQKYIDTIESNGVKLDVENRLTPNSDKNKKSQWVCHSLPTTQNEENIAEDNKTIFDYVKEGNLTKIKSLITADNVNVLDETGIGMIHWAADRGSLDILQYILENSGANINLRDCEDQTALHYASSCGHSNCVEFLLNRGAHVEIKDNSGQTPLDVAFDDNIKSFICNYSL